jgi:hypothetical protein
MANTIGYGQGAVNNTNAWGQGAKVGSPSFSNTQSIELDGIDDYVGCGSTSYLLGVSQFSISLWAKQTTATANKCFISDWGYNSRGNFALETETVSGGDTKIKFSIRDSGAVKTITTTNYVFTENVWNHIAITFNSGTPNIYINGVLQSLSIPSLPTSLQYGNGILEIGKFTGLGRYFNGIIDEVSIFTNELSSTEITSIYNSGVPNKISSLSPLSWYRFEGSGTTATDSGSGGNDGTLTNGVTRSTDVPT